MIKVAVGGASGKLGRMVCGLIMDSDDLELKSAIVSPESPRLGEELFPGVWAVGPDHIEEALRQVEVYVDVSTPTAAAETLPKLPGIGVSVVVGTTGVPHEVMEIFTDRVEKNQVSAVVSPNFAVGVNVFLRTCEMLASALSDFDIEIVEMHHAEKKDAPSGTAIRAAQIISEVTGIEKIVYGRHGNVGARKKEIGVHAIRAGDVIGEHTAIFAGKNERLEIMHRAHSREVFAEGCLKAIRWVAHRRDGKVHDMYEVLGI
jgi:4-hydroxy-tetrahydrodipicolinate reductase